MMDSDESYLLNSYTQNYPHPSPLPSSHPPQKSLNPFINETTPLQKDTKQYQKKAPNNQDDKNLYEQYKTLDSILQDRKQQQINQTLHQFKTITRTLNNQIIQRYDIQYLNTNTLPQNSKLSNQTIFSQHQKSINPFTTQSDKHPKYPQQHQKQNSYSSKHSSKYLNTPYTSYTNQSQSQQPHQQLSSYQQQLHHLKNTYTKLSNSLTLKSTTLSQFLLQFYTQYSSLIHKLQQYQSLVDQLQSLITQQQKYINHYHKQYHILFNKIQKLSQSSSPTFNHLLSNQFKSTINKIGLSICKIVNQEISKSINQYQNNQYVQQGLINIHGNNLKNNNVVNYVQPTMSITKSVPLLATLNGIIQSGTVSSSFIKKNNQIGYVCKNPQNIKCHIEVNRQNNHIKKQKNPQNPQSHFKQTRITTICDQLKTDISPQPYPDHQQPLLPPSSQGETFRKLANLRIKQLQKSNTLLTNQLKSSTIKILILKTQNKQLKQIVQGLIQQISHIKNITSINLINMNQNQQLCFIKRFQQFN